MMMNSDSKPNPSGETQPRSGESKSEPGGGGRHAEEHVPYPKLEPDDVAPVPDTWSSTPSASGETPRSKSDQNSGGYVSATSMPATGSNPYVSADPAPASPMKQNMDKVKDVLGRLGKKAAEAGKKAEDLAGDVWQHLKTGPSLADAAVGKIAQGTKVLAEGGYEKIFQNTFQNVPGEKLLKSYGCYLSTSAGPILGVLYLSTEKVAFCSDNPLSHKVGEEVNMSYYKVVIPLNQLTVVNPTRSKSNPAEKYIQLISVDKHEFWFMGFMTYDSAVKSLLGALPTPHQHS